MLRADWLKADEFWHGRGDLSADPRSFKFRNALVLRPYKENEALSGIRRTKKQGPSAGISVRSRIDRITEHLAFPARGVADLRQADAMDGENASTRSLLGARGHR